MSWTQAAIICAVCGHRWQAVIEGNWSGEPALECGNCGSNSGILEVEDGD